MGKDPFGKTKYVLYTELSCISRLSKKSRLKIFAPPQLAFIVELQSKSIYDYSFI